MSLQVSDLRLVAVALASVALAATTQNSKIRVVPYPGHFFAIQLETNKQTYREGEPISVRISITNVSDQTYSIAHWQPATMLPLVVRDINGVQITPKVPGHIERVDTQSGFTPTYHLAPKATVTVGWTEIREFGYALTRPGTYTITVALYGAGQRRTSQSLESFGMSGQDKSNTVHIKILP